MDGKLLSKLGAVWPNAELYQQLLDRLSEHVAVLDRSGEIVMVNGRWREFAANNSGGPCVDFVGVNYLQTCDKATGMASEEAKAVAEGLRKVLSGEMDQFSTEYPCHSPHNKRWFLMFATPLQLSGGVEGAVVTHIPITERKLAETALAESEARYRDLFDHAHDAIYIVDATTARFVMTNPAASSMLGYSPQELLGMGPADIDADPASVAGEMAREEGIQGGRVFEVEHVTKDGRRIPIELSVRRITFNDRPARLAIARDITQRKEMEEAIRHSENKFRTVADFTYDWEYWRAPSGEMLWVSPACERITGHTAEEFMDDPNLLRTLVLPEDLEAMDQHFTRVAYNSQEKCDIDIRIINRAGNIVWINHKCQEIQREDGANLGRRVCNRDITERKTMEEMLVRLATVDVLTKAYNRRHFIERAEEEFFRSKRYNFPLTVLMIDVDNFKNINDVYGHAQGDETLKVLVNICLETLRDSDIFGRIGGEEFAAVLVHTDHTSAYRIAERLRERISKQIITSDTGSITFTVSIGLAGVKQDSASLEEVLKYADMAMYRAKTHGKNRVEQADAIDT